MRLIDADKLLEKAWDADTRIGYVQVVDVGDILEAPIVDVTDKKVGKWIIRPEVKNIYGGTCIECSECREKYVVQHIEDEKFCRNCGARMEGEEDETD